MSLPHPARHSPLRGCLLMLAASISFAVMNLSGKIVGEGSSGMTALLIRSAATFLFVLPVMVLSGSSILGPRPGLLLLRSLLGTTALACLFISLTKLSTADATILRETAPLFVMLLAPLWLGERVSRAMVAAAVVGFTGVILVLKPWSGLLQIHALIGLLGGFFASLVMMVLRLMRGTYPAHVIVLTFGLGGVLVGIAGGGHHGLGQLPQAIYPWVVTLGVAGTCGQLFLTHAYRDAPASSISPLSLTTVIWAALGEWIISGVIPDIFSMIGFMLVTAGVVSVPFLTPSSKTPT